MKYTHQSFGRIKPKRNVKPNAKEKAYHLTVMELPCMGCGSQQGVVAHHPLTESPLQRWRRDHEFVVPACCDCHSDIHDKFGDEEAWAEIMECELPVRYAEKLRLDAKAEGRL